MAAGDRVYISIREEFVRNLEAAHIAASAQNRTVSSVHELMMVAASISRSGDDFVADPVKIAAAINLDMFLAAKMQVHTPLAVDAGHNEYTNTIVAISAANERNVEILARLRAMEATLRNAISDVEASHLKLGQTLNSFVSHSSVGGYEHQ